MPAWAGAASTSAASSANANGRNIWTTSRGTPASPQRPKTPATTPSVNHIVRVAERSPDSDIRSFSASPAATATVRSVRRTKIVATIGPASRDNETLARMVEAGMDVARLNFSHGTPEQHAETCQRVRNAANRVGRPVAILQDLPGPKLRIGEVEDGRIEMTPGDQVTFICGEDALVGTAHRLYVSWAKLADALNPGDHFYLADGSVRLRVTAVRAGDCEFDAEVRIGGSVVSRQGLNVP